MIAIKKILTMIAFPSREGFLAIAVGFMFLAALDDLFGSIDRALFNLTLAIVCLLFNIESALHKRD